MERICSCGQTGDPNRNKSKFLWMDQKKIALVHFLPQKCLCFTHNFCGQVAYLWRSNLRAACTLLLITMKYPQSLYSIVINNRVQISGRKPAAVRESTGIQLLTDGVNLFVELLIGIIFIGDLVGAVDNGRVVSSSQKGTDRFQRRGSHVLAEVHGNLSR